MRSELAKLLDGTEANAKRIEAIQGEFPTVVLNEWRYATRHIVNYMEKDGDASERDKAENHLARAYYDSCDMLLDCLLNRIREYDEAYGAYPEILAATVPDYATHRQAIRNAHKIHSTSQGFVDAAKRERYAELAKSIEPLDKAVEAYDDAKDDIAKACRRAKHKDFRDVAGFIIAILGIVLAIILWLAPRSP